MDEHKVANCFQSSSILPNPNTNSTSNLPATIQLINTKHKSVDPAATATTANAVSCSRCPPIPTILVPHKSRTRRGKRKSKKHCNKNPSLINSDGNWKIFQSNIRGYNSKKISLKNIVNVNEVGLQGNKKCSIQGYNTFTRNRKSMKMGGIATAVRKDENQFCLKVDEGENNDEYIITRHCQFLKPINVINLYGEQEGRNKNNEIEERWLKICDQLKIIEERSEESLIIGDFNKLVGNGPFGVKSNHSKEVTLFIKCWLLESIYW